MVRKYCIELTCSQIMKEPKPEYTSQEGSARDEEAYNKLRNEKEMHVGPKKIDPRGSADLEKANDACREILQDTLAYELEWGEHMGNSSMDWVDKNAKIKLRSDRGSYYQFSDMYEEGCHDEKEGLRWKFNICCPVIPMDNEKEVDNQ